MASSYDPYDPSTRQPITAHLREQRKQGGGDVSNFRAGMPSYLALGGIVAYEILKRVRSRGRR